MKNDRIIVVTGSKARFAQEMEEVVSDLRASGICAIMDSTFSPLKECYGRKQFMRTILDAATLIVYNKGGYIGFHTLLEIVLAEVAGIEVEYWFEKERRFSSEELSEMYYKWRREDVRV